MDLVLPMTIEAHRLPYSTKGYTPKGPRTCWRVDGQIYGGQPNYGACALARDLIKNGYRLEAILKTYTETGKPSMSGRLEWWAKWATPSSEHVGRSLRPYQDMGEVWNG